MRLAVLIPTFNAGADLDRTLSCLAADPTPFDILLVDDGSDPPVRVASCSGSHVVTVIRHDTNRGIARALNTGLEWVRAREYDYVARLDAGDINEPARLARQLALLDDHRDVALLGAWTRHLDEELRPLYITRYPATWESIRRCFHYRTAFSHTACMMRVAALREVGTYDERFHLGEDYELFWRVAARFRCANVPEVLVTRVESRRSLTYANRLAMGRTRLALQWRHFAWDRLDCWLGVARSIGLLMVPARLVLSVKRASGIVG